MSTPAAPARVLPSFCCAACRGLAGKMVEVPADPWNKASLWLDPCEECEGTGLSAGMRNALDQGRMAQELVARQVEQDKKLSALVQGVRDTVDSLADGMDVGIVVAPDDLARLDDALEAIDRELNPGDYLNEGNVD